MKPVNPYICLLPAWVLKSGCSSFILAGENFLWHSGETWFLKWNTSIILFTSNHTLSRGGGKGSGPWPTFNLARLHILSYAKVICFCRLLILITERSHWIMIKNTCDGDSDLKGKHTDPYYVLLKYWMYNQTISGYLYKDCQVSICPPPRTTNWCPLDHFLRRLPCPVSLWQTGSVWSLRMAPSASSGWLSIRVAIPVMWTFF